MSSSGKFECECRKCGVHVTVEKPDSSHPCSNCGSPLTPAPKQCYWIFQFNPKSYKCVERMHDNALIDKPAQWLTSRFSEYMKKDDFVAIWASGKKPGIIALGKLVTSPTDNPLNLKEQKFMVDERAIDKFLYNKSVFVKYFRDLSANSLLEHECLSDDILRTMDVLKHRQATNFQITKDEWNRIIFLSSKKT